MSDFNGKRHNLSPQLRACVMSIYPQNKSAAVVPKQIRRTQQLPFQTCKLLHRVNWNAKNNADSLFLANCLYAASKCNDCWVPTNQQPPPRWVMKAFKGPAVAQWRLKWDNNDFLRGLQDTPPACTEAAWALQVFVQRKLITAAIQWWKRGFRYGVRLLQTQLQTLMRSDSRVSASVFVADFPTLLIEGYF